MKKKFFLIGALVAMSMSVMFVACSKNDQNTASDGCDCTINDGYGPTREHFSKGDMAQMGATSCAELTGVLRGMYVSHDQSASISCQ